jgi:hypothetical protein
MMIPSGAIGHLLRAVGTSLPTLSLMMGEVGFQDQDEAAPAQVYDNHKFTPLDLSPYFNCSPGGAKLAGPTRLYTWGIFSSP